MAEELNVDTAAQRIRGTAHRAKGAFLRQHGKPDPEFIARLSTTTLGTAAAEAIERARLYAAETRVAGWNRVADRHQSIGDALHANANDSDRADVTGGDGFRKFGDEV